MINIVKYSLFSRKWKVWHFMQINTKKIKYLLSFLLMQIKNTCFAARRAAMRQALWQFNLVLKKTGLYTENKFICSCICIFRIFSKNFSYDRLNLFARFKRWHPTNPAIHVDYTCKMAWHYAANARATHQTNKFKPNRLIGSAVRRPETTNLFCLVPQRKLRFCVVNSDDSLPRLSLRQINKQIEIVTC